MYKYFSAPKNTLVQYAACQCQYSCSTLVFIGGRYHLPP